MEDLLYHYTDQNGLMGILTTKTLWATKIHYLNDSKEFVHAIDEVKSIIWDRKNDLDKTSLKALYETMESRLDSTSRVNIFIASLTEEGDLLSQWRGYCPNNAGYSIGFSKNEIIKISENQGFSFKPCIYDRHKKIQIIHDLLGHSEKCMLEGMKIDDIIGQFIYKFLHIAPFLKHEAFSEEKEWRLVSGVVQTTDKRWKTRSGKSTLIPYIEIDFSCINNSIPVRKVVVGPNHNMHLAADAVSTYLSVNDIKNWSTMVSQIPYRTE